MTTQPWDWEWLVLRGSNTDCRKGLENGYNQNVFYTFMEFLKTIIYKVKRHVISLGKILTSSWSSHAGFCCQDLKQK